MTSRVPSLRLYREVRGPRGLPGRRVPCDREFRPSAGPAAAPVGRRRSGSDRRGARGRDRRVGQHLRRDIDGCAIDDGRRRRHVPVRTRHARAIRAARQRTRASSRPSTTPARRRRARRPPRSSCSTSPASSRKSPSATPPPRSARRRSNVDAVTVDQSMLESLPVFDQRLRRDDVALPRCRLARQRRRDHRRQRHGSERAERQRVGRAADPDQPGSVLGRVLAARDAAASRS